MGILRFSFFLIYRVNIQLRTKRDPVAEYLLLPLDLLSMDHPMLRLEIEIKYNLRIFSMS